MSVKQRVLRILQKLILMTNEYEMFPVPKPIDTSHKLEGKVALITGGSSGIGLAMAETFVREGCKVIIAGTNEEKLETAVDKLGE